MVGVSREQIEQYLRPPTKESRIRALLRLSFAPELEARYQKDHLEEWTRRHIRTGLFIVVLFNCFLISDYQEHPQDLVRCLVLRLGVFTPSVLLVCWILYLKPRAVIRESLIAAAASIGGAVVLGVSVNVDKVLSTFSQTGLVLIVFFGTLIQRMQWPFPVFCNGVLLIADAVFLVKDAWLTPPEKLTSIFLTSTTVIVSLIATYRMEREERISYALYRREEINSEVLAALNAKLTALSTIDGLTGLANRRYYEQRFAQLWDTCLQNGRSLSLLMLDIDHFKRLNDTAGHLFGDEVLISTGQTLGKAVRGSEDLVARYGGEEFICLLPGSDLQQAGEIAERMRVTVAGQPFTTPAGEPYLITISCGVATFSASELKSMGREKSTLVAQADRALYTAKRSGRNRVCCGGQGQIRQPDEQFPRKIERTQAPAPALAVSYGGPQAPSH